MALVTGASAGIGAFTAAALARAGYRVFGTSRQPEAGGAREVEMLALDVQSDASVAACLEQVLGAAGRLDLLVNNAGLGHNSLIEETSLEQARFVVETNFWGAVRVTTAALPAMRQQRAGRVIVLGSVAGLIGAVGMAYYSASKFALEGWAEALSYEVEPFGVRVSLVEPGYFKTHAGASLLTAARTSPESLMRGCFQLKHFPARSVAAAFTCLRSIFSFNARSICRSSMTSPPATKLVASPSDPARPVRPTRWMKSSAILGRS